MSWLIKESLIRFVQKCWFIQGRKKKKTIPAAFKILTPEQVNTCSKTVQRECSGIIFSISIIWALKDKFCIHADSFKNKSVNLSFNRFYQNADLVFICYKHNIQRLWNITKIIFWNNIIHFIKWRKMCREHTNAHWLYIANFNHDKIL